MSTLTLLYFNLSDWLMEKAVKEKKYELWQGHSQLAIMFSTGLLMWGYALLAYFTISDPTPSRVGVVASSIHFLSPLALRYPGSIKLACHLLVGAGLIHQGCFAYYSGGFNSNILIWYGILPMLAGIMIGRMGVIIWMSITTLLAITALIHMIYFGGSPMLISQEGWVIAQGMMVFGWIFLSSLIIYVFTNLMDMNSERLLFKATKIRTLVRVLCHDIINPLFTLKYRLNSLKKDTQRPESLEKIQKMELPLDVIQEIINQVKNWEAIHSGKMQLELEAVSMNEVIQNTLDLFQEKLKQKNLSIDLSLPENTFYIYAHKATLQAQILSNILSNAIKFSHAGSTIHIALKECNGKALLTIKDHGIGIPERILNNLFDPSEKTSRPGTNGEKGTGFGMPIVKAYIEEFGGVIQVQSAQGELDPGTVFNISFPLHV